MKRKKIYALYKGDEFIDIGTKEYLAKILKVKVNTIDFYQSPYWLKKTNYESYVVIKIGESYLWKDKQKN